MYLSGSFSFGSSGGFRCCLPCSTLQERSRAKERKSGPPSEPGFGSYFTCVLWCLISPRGAPSAINLLERIERFSSHLKSKKSPRKKLPLFLFFSSRCFTRCSLLIRESGTSPSHLRERSRVPSFQRNGIARACFGQDRAISVKTECFA